MYILNSILNFKLMFLKVVNYILDNCFFFFELETLPILKTPKDVLLAENLLAKKKNIQ